MFSADGEGSLRLEAAASTSRSRGRPRSIQPPMKRFLIKRPLNVSPRWRALADSPFLSARRNICNEKRSRN